MIVEVATATTGAVVIAALRAADRIHKRIVEDERIDDIDVEEARRLLERDRAEWWATLRVHQQRKNEKHMQACSEAITRIDRKLLALAGYRSDK